MTDHRVTSRSVSVGAVDLESSLRMFSVLTWNCLGLGAKYGLGLHWELVKKSRLSCLFFPHAQILTQSNSFLQKTDSSFWNSRIKQTSWSKVLALNRIWCFQWPKMAFICGWEAKKKTPTNIKNICIRVPVSVCESRAFYSPGLHFIEIYIWYEMRLFYFILLIYTVYFFYILNIVSLFFFTLWKV